MQIKFTANSKGKPPKYEELNWKSTRKLADCEIWFEEGPLAGYKLQGFVIAERVTASDVQPKGALSVYPPNYRPMLEGGRVSSNSIGLLRPVNDDSYDYGTIKGPLRDQIITAFQNWNDELRSRPTEKTIDTTLEMLAEYYQDLLNATGGEARPEEIQINMRVLVGRYYHRVINENAGKVFFCLGYTLPHFWWQPPDPDDYQTTHFITRCAEHPERRADAPSADSCQRAATTV